MSDNSNDIKECAIWAFQSNVDKGSILFRC